MSFFRHISGKFALTNASANDGGTALPHCAICLSLASLTPQLMLERCPTISRITIPETKNPH